MAMAEATLVNCTPHPVNIGSLEIPPSGIVPRLPEETRQVDSITYQGTEIPIVETTYGSSAELPLPPPRRLTEEEHRWLESRRGCSMCGRRGCNRTNHSHPTCVACGSAYCNGDDCPKTVLRREQAIARRIARHERTWRNWPN